MSRLIVNADDYGYTTGIHRAAHGLFSLGALSSATAMATGAAIGRRSGPGVPTQGSPALAIGAHIVLVDGSPVHAPGTIPTLLQAGRFRPALGRFLLDLTRGRVCPQEIEEEAVAQIRSLQARGFSLTHLDTHKHTHMFAGVLQPLLRAAVRCGIGAIRNPFEPAWARRATRGAPLLRRSEVALLSLGRQQFLRAVHRAGLRTTAGALGVLATGTLNAPTLDALLAALARHGRPEETWELVCHPGFRDEELDRLPTRLRAEREQEYEALRQVVPRWTQGPGSAHTLVDFGNL